MTPVLTARTAKSLWRRRARIATAAATLAMITVVPLMVIVVAIGGTPAVGAPVAGFAGDIPPMFVTAYNHAARRCAGLSWTVLAGIGRIESNHGRINPAATVTPDGDVTPPIIGIALDGTNNTAAVRVPAGGSPWHPDPIWDHATGPMQFITATWAAVGVDANGDGVASPHNVWDATATAADYLCGPDGNINPADIATEVARYNNSAAYVADVLTWAAQYQAATTPATGSPGGPDAPVPLATVDGITVHASLAPNLAALLAHAQADGIDLSGSGWRSYQQQVELRRDNGCPDLYTAPPSTCRVPTAIPGTSRHETGLAIDFTTAGRTIATRTHPAYHWLAANAATYGLYNLPSEPWHWSTDGR